MGLTAQQLAGLNVAAARKAKGTASPVDLANMDYATKTYGWTPAAQQNVHGAIQTAAKKNPGLLNDPGAIRNIATDATSGANTYADSATGLIPPGFSDTHKAIQDTVDNIRKRLADLQAQDAAASAPVTPVAPSGVTGAAINPGESLADFYARLATQNGVQEGNTQIANLEGAIRGTEGDIQTEANRSGGEVTASQLEGLKASRTTPLYNKLQTLYDLRSAKETYISNVINLTKEDRQAASDRLDKELNLSSTIAQLKQTEDQLSYQEWKDVQGMAQKHLDTLITTGAIANQPDASLADLARTTGYSLTDITALRAAARRKVVAEDQNNELNKQKALLDMESTRQGMSIAIRQLALQEANTRSEIAARGANIALQREELALKKANGGLTPIEAANNPIVAFKGMGGRIDRNEVGGYSFSLNGKPITVDQAVDMVPGSSRSDFLAGSKDAADRGFAYNKQQLTALGTLTDNIAADADIKNFKILRDGLNTVRTGASAGNGAGDMALIYGYMKLLDPGSSVKEGEYASAKNAGSVPSKVIATYNKLIKGGMLSEKQREDFVRQAEQQYQAKTPSYLTAYNKFKNQAASYGIQESDVLGDLSAKNYSVVAGGKTYEFDTFDKFKAFKKKFKLK